MRAGLCTVSAPLAACRIPAATALIPSARFLSLHLLTSPASTHQQTLYFVVDVKSKVKEVYAATCSYFSEQGMQDSQLFGLAIICDGEYLFADSESKLSKYAPKNWRSSHTHGLDANGRPSLTFYYRVKIYVNPPIEFRDDMSRHYYYLQLRHNVASRQSATIADTGILLGGLALQADLGDKTDIEKSKINKMSVPYFRPEDYVPITLRFPWGIQAIEASHAKNRGLTQSDAEMQYIQMANRISNQINTHIFKLRSTKHESTINGGTIMLTVFSNGIQITPDNNPTSTFLWTSIEKLSFERKRFEMRTNHEKLTLYTTNEEKSKLLWQLCRDTHCYSMSLSAKLVESRKIKVQEHDQKRCYMLQDWSINPRLINKKQSSNRLDQRISVISNTSSNTTSGIVSDRVHSEDELEIMINSPPVCTNNQKAITSSTPAFNLTNSHRSSSCGSSTTNDASSKTCLSPQSTDRLSLSISSLDLGLSNTYQNSTISSLDVESVDYYHKKCMVNGKAKFYGSSSSGVCTSQTSGVYTMASSQATEINDIDNNVNHFLKRSDSNLSISGNSFHGDGSDPTDNQRQTLLSARELSDLIVDQENHRQSQKNLTSSIESVLKHRLPPPPPYHHCVKSPVFKPFKEPPPVSSIRHAPPPPPQLQPQPQRIIDLRKSEIEQYQRQLNSNTDFVYFPSKEPSISKQEYIDAKNGSRQMLAAAIASCTKRLPHNYYVKYASSHNLLQDKNLSLVQNDQLVNFEDKKLNQKINRTKSDDNILNSLNEPNRLSKSLNQSPKNVIDFRKLREKSKNLDLPIISALCNDKKLIKQTKAFRSHKSQSDMTDLKTMSTTSLNSKKNLKPITGVKNRKVILGNHHRNPADKLPDIPRAISNSYVLTDTFAQRSR